MDNCSWCGEVVTGENTVREWRVVDGSWECQMFCCFACAWQWNVKSHEFWGMSGHEIRSHLITVHGLRRPCSGDSWKKQSVECDGYFLELKGKIRRFLKSGFVV